jgi:hypothetical protein
MATLRKSIMSGTYADGTPCLYSGVISDPGLLAPYVANTDHLFFEP